ELYITDGTAPGTTLLASALQPTPALFGVAAGRLLFGVPRPSIGRDLWATDGSPGGTGLVASIDVLGRPRTFRGPLAFVAATPDAGRELWHSDGTMAGTSRITDLVACAGDGVGLGLEVLGPRVLFTGMDAAAGLELWSSDGTTGGTALLADLTAGT